MNSNIKRGLVLVALTGGFAALGANAASAIDLPDLDGDAQVDADAPATVDGLTVTVLGGSGTGPLLGDGVFASTGSSTLDLFAQQGVGAGDLLDDDTQTAQASAPVDASNAWVSVFSKGGSGIIVVPDSKVDSSAATAGTVDGDVVAPVTVDCVTVTVLSDYERDCAASSAASTDAAAPAEPGAAAEGDAEAEAGAGTGVGGVGGGDEGAVDNGGNDGAVEGDACVTAGTTLNATAAADTHSGVEAALVGGGAIAGGLVALGLIALGRKVSIL